MNIFEIVNYNVTFSPQALVLKPFKEIWLNDKSKDKAKAIRELSFVYYMADERSDYMYAINEEERKEYILKDLGIEENWFVPKYVEDAILFYKESSETTSTQMLKSARLAVSKISAFLDNIDVNERDKYNKPMFDINKITGAVEKIPKLIKALNEIEREIVKEMAIKAQSGNKTMGLFEGGEL